MSESYNFDKNMSFEELYDRYYLLQMGKREIPIVRNFLDLQQGTMKILGEKVLKKLGKGKDTLFLPDKSLEGLVKFENSLAEDKIRGYSSEIEGEIDLLKKVIKNKVLDYVHSDNFKVNFDLSYGGANYDNPNEKAIKESFSMKLTGLNSESALGVYYVFNGDIPQTEFFSEQYGFALKISKFPEVEEKIKEIRELHGIKKPRDLSRTIDEKGRHEENNKKQTSLLYAISGEKEIYDFLNGYLNLNFGIPAKSDQGFLLPALEEKMLLKFVFDYDKRIIKKKKSDEESNKWGVVWTGDVSLNLVELYNYQGDSKPNNFKKDSFREHSHFEEEGDPEKVCAVIIEKFVEKDLTDKLKIGLSKKYY